jgi:ribosomal protein S8E
MKEWPIYLSDPTITGSFISSLKKYTGATKYVYKNLKKPESIRETIKITLSTENKIIKINLVPDNFKFNFFEIKIAINRMKTS